MELNQLDVKTIFLYDDLEEKIYISQPKGFKTARKENMMQTEEIIIWIKAISKAMVQVFR